MGLGLQRWKLRAGRRKAEQGFPGGEDAQRQYENKIGLEAGEPGDFRETTSPESVGAWGVGTAGRSDRKAGS